MLISSLRDIPKNEVINIIISSHDSILVYEFNLLRYHATEIADHNNSYKNSVAILVDQTQTNIKWIIKDRQHFAINKLKYLFW